MPSTLNRSQNGNHQNKKACQLFFDRQHRLFQRYVSISHMIHMTNITRLPFNYKGSGTIFYHLTNEEYCRFKRAGIIAKKLHTYRLVLSFREIQVECPVILRDKRPVAVVLPAFKLPYRPYPCFVYLFAIALYLTGVRMRKAAIITGKKFGIPGFSHSTISRAFSRMVLNSEMLEILLHDEALPDTTANIALPGKPGCIISPHCSGTKKKTAPLLFSVLTPILEIPFKDSLLVYEHFMRYCCLLL